MTGITQKIPNLQVQKTGSRKNFIHSVTGFVELPSWTGYFLKEDATYSIMDKMVTNGNIELTVDCAFDPDGSIYPTDAQVNAYHYLTEQEEKIKWAILQELKEALPRLFQDEYASWDQEEGGFPLLADLTPAFDFKRYIGPSSIEITDDVRDEVAYLHWHFACRWDPEHGFQVITHKERIIDLSPDTDIFKIYKDNGTYEQVKKEYKDKVWVVPKKKKWWQFW